MAKNGTKVAKKGTGDVNPVKDATKKIKKAKKDVATREPKGGELKEHKNQLSSLAEKDPEFFQFLQENDQELLEFDDEGLETDGEDDDEEVGEDDEDDEEGEEGAEEAESDEEEDGVDFEAEDSRKVVDMDTIKQWSEKLKTNSNIKTLKTLMHVYHSAVQDLSAEEEADPDEAMQMKTSTKNKWKVEGGAIVNNLITMCLKHVIPGLEEYLAYTNAKKKAGKRASLPSSSKQWSLVKATVKQYLLDTLQLLRQLSDASMLTVMLRHTQNLCAYFACFPKITRVALKRFIRMWSSGEEHVRVLAFMCIRKCTLLLPTLYETILKKVYMAFVRNTKFVTAKSLPLVAFMENSLVEILAINTAATYQHAFVYIRQLAIHLRNAMVNKKKDAYQSVYNWQFICCLQLWARAVSDLHCDTLHPLVFPVVQIVLGVIRLIPSTRWFPLRFNCVRMLNLISRTTGVYIPTATYLVQTLSYPEFQKKPSSTKQSPDMASVLKLTKQQMGSKGFQDSVIDSVFELLLDHYSIYSCSIAVPELVFPTCHQLKRIIKQSKVAKMNRDMKMLVDKLQERAKELTERRSLVSFAPVDSDKVDEWEKAQEDKPNSLRKYCDAWKKMQKMAVKIKEENAVDEDDDDEGDVEEVVNKKKKKKNSSAKKQKLLEPKEEPKSEEEEADDTEPKKKKKKKKKATNADESTKTKADTKTNNSYKKNKKKTKPVADQSTAEGEDILEAFTFSDED